MSGPYLEEYAERALGAVRYTCDAERAEAALEDVLDEIERCRAWGGDLKVMGLVAAERACLELAGEYCDWDEDTRDRVWRTSEFEPWTAADLEELRRSVVERVRQRVCPTED